MKSKPFAGHSSASSEGSSSPSAGESNSSTVIITTATSRGSSSSNSSRPSGRRGHSKSRLGCLNCKRRRVKCNELRPTCSPCRRLGLLCDYASTPASLRPSPSPLSLEDLRFYHQFLTTAYPSLPLRADDVWAQCAALSHQSECLAHAALALGASHLSKHGQVDYSPQALSHRVSALKLVHEQFARPPKDQANADSLFAALLCLATQTTLLPDGIAEYMTITRAGALVRAFVIPAHRSSVFKTFTTENHTQHLSKIASEEPKDFAVVDQFLASVLKVKEICSHPRELYYCQRVLDCVGGLRVSSLQAWLSHADLWRVHCYFSNDDFQAFIDPENYPALLLILHMLLADYLLGQYCTKMSEQFKFTARRQVIVSWVRNALEQLPDEYKPHGAWLKSYCHVVEKSDGRYLFTP